MVGVEYFTDELSFESSKVCFCDKYGQSMLHSVFLPNLQSFFRVDLYDSSALVKDTAFIEISLFFDQLTHRFCLLDNWH